MEEKINNLLNENKTLEHTILSLKEEQEKLKNSTTNNIIINNNLNISTIEKEEEKVDD